MRESIEQNLPNRREIILETRVALHAAAQRQQVYKVAEQSLAVRIQLPGSRDTDDDVLLSGQFMNQKLITGQHRHVNGAAVLCRHKFEAATDQFIKRVFFMRTFVRLEQRVRMVSG